MSLTGRTTPLPVDVHVGRRVAERRMSLGHTQSDLGKALGITFQQVQKYERGTNRISASKLWMTASFLGVGVEYFFSGLGQGLGLAEPDGPSFDYGEPPATRQSIEIARLSPRLNADQQKLVLGLIRQMKSDEASA